MTLPIGSAVIGTRLTLATILLAIALFSYKAQADDSSSSAFNEEVINLLLESRIQKPASQASVEERADAIHELENIYVVSDLPAAIALGDEPRLGAQLDLQRRALLFNAYASTYIADNRATDQEISAAYQEQIALSPPQEFKARHILVDTQGAAVGLIEELQSGADFSTLAKEHSTGPSGASGGDLGWFPVTAMVKPFSDAVAALEDGAFTSTPVQTQFGWHVIIRDDTRDSTPPPLESVKDVISQRIEQQKFLDFVENLRSPAAD